MTKAEKAALIFGLGYTALLAVYSIVKPRITQRSKSESLIERRNEILNKDNMRVLYSIIPANEHPSFYDQLYTQQNGLKEVTKIGKVKIPENQYNYFC
ncbi:unnamed protein product (macronuclear) [Paramecium tetraurelia]|uniref:Uncharacterized protein n=1 Tax=Paramecium tetraurelia TaxID=5888 RepID=A0D3A9_PARTE|nr:uncharacterized protein GSPATT00013011001 [Paramecium tetraurelia]CAK77526.1 unnamed protein product [Paramecium tetraurelia]|eukprot:XP_001444923.1 hypothetical protein (macronuclear) [Paramecium tetraurelia strain d4-2]